MRSGLGHNRRFLSEIGGVSIVSSDPYFLFVSDSRRTRNWIRSFLFTRHHLFGYRIGPFFESFLINTLEYLRKLLGRLNPLRFRHSPYEV
jgi:hypothetical protein